MDCLKCNKCLVDSLGKPTQDAIEIDCKSSFVRIHDYFSANVVKCNNCKSIYLKGYYEDFTNREIWEEFGDRYYIEREITEKDYEIILEHENQKDLDINTFGQ